MSILKTIHEWRQFCYEMYLYNIIKPSLYNIYIYTNKNKREGLFYCYISIEIFTIFNNYICENIILFYYLYAIFIYQQN